MSEPTITLTLEDLLQLGAKAKGLNFLPNKNLNSVFSGRHASRIRGRGMDFLELKSYVQGDDIKHIDWRATRRANKTYVRVYNEERDRSVYVVVSQQSPMFFASQGSFKSVQAAKVASIVAHAVLKSGDRVGAVIFGDNDLKAFKASKSRRNSTAFLEQLAHFNQALLKRESEADSEQFNKALDFLLTQVKHDDLIVLIGDGSALNARTQEKITHLSMHNSIIGVLLYDPLERALPKEASLLFRSLHKRLHVNSSTKAFQEAYSAAYQAKKELYSNLSLMYKIPLIEISTSEDVLLQLRKQLGVYR